METLVHETLPSTTKPLKIEPLRHLTSQDIEPLGHPGDECPACRSKHMCWMANDNLDYNYLCEVCGRCWSLSPNGVTRVNPLLCTDCEHREACLEGLRKQLAASHWLPAVAS
jgi:hypothetical protein